MRLPERSDHPYLHPAPFEKRSPYTRALPFLFILFLYLSPLRAQKDASYELDLKDAKNVVRAIFHAAETEELKILQCLCDPYRNGDNDTKNICGLAKLKEQHMEDGELEHSTFEGDRYVKVTVRLGKAKGDGTQKEKMKLVERHGNWYLSSF